MGKKKLQRFAENATFKHVVQPNLTDTLHTGNAIKGKWNEQMFKNNNPITLELGCGRGEYSVELARKNQHRNYIGVDIKGARLWRGAKTAFEENLKNVAFLRSRIEFITHYFDKNEIDEIWITFPDPQLKKRRAKNRLTHSSFLTLYQQFVKDDNTVHLKTDSLFLHKYTKKILNHNGIEIIEQSENIYAQSTSETLAIKTTYEQKFLEQALPITYLKFKLDKLKKLTEPEHSDDKIF